MTLNTKDIVEIRKFGVSLMKKPTNTVEVRYKRTKLSMSARLFLPFLFILCANTLVSAASKDIWKHVVNVDRLVWQERSDQKKINDLVDEESFVRRIYLDITGRIPTYEQMIKFRKDKSIDKFPKLIDELLDSPGYVSHYTVFWKDLLRVHSENDNERYKHKEYTRYIERFLAENKSYDKIVKDLIMAEGSVYENPAMAFYGRDKGTGFTDTFNATIRAFLGTRLGCAQCHNHRFDKWKQKDFLEMSSFMQGVKHSTEGVFGPSYARMVTHMKAMAKDKRWKEGDTLNHYERMLLAPSYQSVTFTKEKYVYPDNYIYDNAKPGDLVKPRIVFDYGDKVLKGESRREQFANWLTSKNNIMFARVFTNRLWKRIMGVANMYPVDDYKDNLTIQNEELFELLGDVFINLDYDIKDFLRVVFNTEAYLYAYDPKNEFEQDEYKLQGALMKRMSSSQVYDSLLVLRYGDVGRFSRLDPQYFEFEDRLYELINEYKKEMFPRTIALERDYPKDKALINDEMIDIMFKYLDKVREIEDYYQIDRNGRLKNNALEQKGLKSTKAVVQNTMMMGEEMMMAMNAYGNTGELKMASYSRADLIDVFGRSDRSAPKTDLDTTATMQQLLKLMNSESTRGVASPDSYLMKQAMTKENLSDRVAYLYYSIYGRAPDKSEVIMAKDYCEDMKDVKKWSQYVLALMNSPEFYFIK